MKKLSVYVCENYNAEFQYIFENDKLENIEIVPFKSFCDGGVSVGEQHNEAVRPIDSDMDAVLVCSHLCKVSRKCQYDKDFLRIYESDFCYSHMINDHFVHFFLQEGYYVITTGWLINWQEHIRRQGFTREVARDFYNQTCKKLVFLDTGIYDESEKQLTALSNYLDIPVSSIPVNLEPIKNLFNVIISEWKYHQLGIERQDELCALRELNARNSAILNIMSKIAGAEYKRDVISMLDQIWMTLFGASKSRFWGFDEMMSEIPRKLKVLDFSNRIYLIDKDENAFYALLESGGEKYGIVEVGDFLFPDNIDKYAEMFNSLIRIASLAISNTNRYEELVISKNKFEYNSHHDGLTGVYNRTYYNKILQSKSEFTHGAVFSIDLDGLKAVNDNLGHSQGDLLIQEAADILKKTFRDSDPVFRMGGDEFVVFVYDCDQELAENLENRLKDIIIKQNQRNTLQLSLSVGFCVSSESCSDIELMVQKADMKMYREKRNRKVK